MMTLLFPWASPFCGQPSDPVSRGQEVSLQEKSQEPKAEAQPEKIITGPKNIKESTAIYVFLGWLWISIGVLIYILRLKIKEADRLHAIKFFTPDKK